MRRLIEQQKGIPVIGKVGIPTAIAAVPVARRSKVPFFAALSGAGILRRIPWDDTLQITGPVMLKQLLPPYRHPSPMVT